MDDAYDSPWDHAIPGESSHEFLNLSNGNIDGNVGTSLYESGSDSLSLTSAYLRLKQEGSDVTIDDFLQAATAATQRVIHNPMDHSLAATGVGAPSVPLKTYCKKPLSKIPVEKAQYLLADCFAHRGNLGRGAGLTTEDFAVTVRRAWPKLSLDLSFALIDEATDEIKGITTLADEFDLMDITSEGYHPCLQEIGSYLGGLTTGLSGFMPEPLQKGMVLSVHLIATSADTTPAENVNLVYLMEQEIHRLGRLHKFQISVAYNTSRVTQEMAELFGCQRLVMDTPKHYVNSRGEKPFSGLSESITVAVDVHHYD